MTFVEALMLADVVVSVAGFLLELTKFVIYLREKDHQQDHDDDPADGNM